MSLPIRIHRLAVCAAMAVFALAQPATAQQEAFELPELDTEQRLGRMISNLNALSVAMIHYGEEKGDSPETVGRVVGTLFGPGWSSEPGTGTPEQMAAGMARNLQMWPDMMIEVAERSEHSITLRYNRPWTSWFGDDGMAYGVSVEEYETMFAEASKAIGDYLGLAVEDKRDGDHRTLTIQDKM